MAFTSSPALLERQQHTHATVTTGAPVWLAVRTCEDDPIHVVILGETSTGGVVLASSRCPLVTRGVVAHVELGPLAEGLHRFVVLGLRDLPPQPAHLLDGSVDDLCGRGLTSVTGVTCHAVPPPTSDT